MIGTLTWPKFPNSVSFFPRPKIPKWRKMLSKCKETTGVEDLGRGSVVVAKDWPWILSLHEYRTVLLLEPTKPRQNIRVQNQKKWQFENCLCKTSRSGIDHPGVSRTSFYTIFQYWSNQRRKESRCYYKKFKRPKRFPLWAKNYRRTNPQYLHYVITQ